ncbi:MAG: NUDIX domain-containing protein [Rectinemataceae bacterium]
MRRSVAAVAIRDGKIFVAQRNPGGELGMKWEFPGGKVEEGEDDETALLREFAEEFGVAIFSLARLGEIGFLHKGAERRLCAWRIRIEPESFLELREHMDIDWVDREALKRLDLVDSDRQLLPFIEPALESVPESGTDSTDS